MAKPPQAAVSSGINPALEAEAIDRVAEARLGKALVDRDLREGYFFGAPQRARQVTSRSDVSQVKPDDAGVLNTSFAFELCQDFPTVILNTFLPEAERWAGRKPSYKLPKELVDKAKEIAAAGDEKIYQAIGESNLYAECGKGFMPDLALGTVAMWIQPGRSHEAPVCRAVPIRELEICLGPDGEVDDRWVIRHTSLRKLKGLLRGHDVTLPADIEKLIATEPKKKVAVAFGFWRDWSDENETVWQHVVLLDDKLVKHAKIKGEGSCPLIVARFNAAPEYAWGLGPLIQSLPDLRHLDALAEAKIDNLELGLRPPVSYPDDSFANIEEGLEPGMAYPIRPGTEGAIKNIYTPNPPDAAIYERQDLEQRLKRLFFLDWPEQRGDTPPTATQWLDQMTMAQRRIGTPGLVFWKEFCAGVFTRVQHILKAQGVLGDEKLNDKALSLTPFNPAQRAAEQQEVAAATRAIEICGKAFAEEFKVHVDGAKSMDNIIKKLGADKILVPREAEAVAGALDQIKQLMGGAIPGGPAGGMAPAGGPPVAPDMAGAAPAPAALNIKGAM